MATNEAFSRTLIDAQLGDAGWKISDGVSTHFEYSLSDGAKADYLLCDRNGRGLAVVEAKRSSVHARAAADQARHYAELVDVPFIFLGNGLPSLPSKSLRWRLHRPHSRPCSISRFSTETV